MPYLLPVRFALSSRLRVFGPQPRIFSFRKKFKPFVRFSPTVCVSHPQVPQRFPCPCSTKAKSLCPSPKLTRPSAFMRTRNPSSHRCRRLKEVGLSLRSHPPRVWLPSRGFSSLVPRKPLSAPNALGLLPSELSSTRESKKRFPLSSFVPALFSKTFPALHRRSDDFLLTDSHSPSLLPEGLAQVGGAALLGFLTYQALSPSIPQKKASPFLLLPSRPFSISSLTRRTSITLRVFSI